MSVSQNTENEQQNNLCTTLTEQWKKGELKEGWYYIECIDLPERWIDIDYYRNDCYEDGGFCKGFFDHNDWRGIDKVLAPVPSYEGWQKLIDTNDTIFRQIKDINSENYELEKQNTQLRKWCEEFNALDVAKENQQLKELLYQSVFYLDCHLDADGDVFVNDVSTSAFIEKIDNAIGEKK